MSYYAGKSYRKPDAPIVHMGHNIQPNSRRAAKLAIWERKEAEKRRRRKVKQGKFLRGMRASQVCVDDAGTFEVTL